MSELDFSAQGTPDEAPDFSGGGTLVADEPAPAPQMANPVGLTPRGLPVLDPIQVAATGTPTSQGQAEFQASPGVSNRLPTNITPQPTPYETQLSAFDERRYQLWKATNAPHDSGDDYDLRGAFKAGVTADAGNGHFPDTFKKPNHPTFSDQSMYSTDKTRGGTWGKDEQGRDTFTPSKQMAGDPERVKQMSEYLQRADPNVVVLPPSDHPEAPIFRDGPLPAFVAGLQAGGVGRALSKGAEIAGVPQPGLEQAPNYRPKTMSEKVAHTAGDMLRRMPLFTIGENPWLGGAMEGAGNVILDRFTGGPDANKSIIDEAARGAVTFGPLSFIGPAKTFLASITTKPLKDAAVQTVAGAMYDAIVHDKMPDPEALAKQGIGSTMAFSVLGALTHGLSKASGKTMDEAKQGATDYRTTEKARQEAASQERADYIKKAKAGDPAAKEWLLRNVVGVPEQAPADFSSQAVKEPDLTAATTKWQEAGASPELAAKIAKAEATGDKARVVALVDQMSKEADKAAGQSKAKSIAVERDSKTAESAKPTVNANEKTVDVPRGTTPEPIFTPDQSTEHAEGYGRGIAGDPAKIEHLRTVEAQYRRIDEGARAMAEATDIKSESDKFLTDANRAQKIAALHGEAADAASEGASKETAAPISKPPIQTLSKGQAEVSGIKVNIETPAGEKRKPDHVPLTDAYGRIPRTEGADGDPIDVFVKSDAPESGKVYVVDQMKQDGTFDENKIVVNATSPEDAKVVYLRNYPPGWNGFGGVKEMTVSEFQAWSKSDAPKKAKAVAATPQESTPVVESKTAKALDKPAESAIDKALRSVGVDPNATVSKARSFRVKADTLSKEAARIIDRIPAGQPVSSTKDRNLRERAFNKMRQASELIKQAEEIESSSIGVVQGVGRETGVIATPEPDMAASPRPAADTKPLNTAGRIKAKLEKEKVDAGNKELSQPRASRKNARDTQARSLQNDAGGDRGLEAPARAASRQAGATDQTPAVQAQPAASDGADVSEKVKTFKVQYVSKDGIRGNTGSVEAATPEEAAATIEDGGDHIVVGIDGKKWKNRSAVTGEELPDPLATRRENAATKTLRGVDAFMQEKIAFGGDIVSRGEAMTEMKKDGLSPKQIDAYMMGAKTVTEPPALSGLEAVNKSASISVKAPHGATMIRGTDAKGRKQVIPLSDLKKANVFRDADIVKVEAGTRDRKGAFLPMKGDVDVEEAPKHSMDESADEGVQGEPDASSRESGTSPDHANPSEQGLGGVPDHDPGWQGWLDAGRSRLRRATPESSSDLEGVEVDHALGNDPEFRAVAAHNEVAGYLTVPVKKSKPWGGLIHGQTIYVARSRTHSVSEIGAHERFHGIEDGPVAQALIAEVDTESAAAKAYKDFLVKSHTASFQAAGTPSAVAKLRATRYVTDDLVAKEMAADKYAGIKRKYGVNIDEAFKDADHAGKLVGIIDYGMREMSKGDPELFSSMQERGPPDIRYSLESAGIPEKDYEALLEQVRRNRAVMDKVNRVGNAKADFVSAEARLAGEIHGKAAGRAEGRKEGVREGLSAGKEIGQQRTEVKAKRKIDELREKQQERLKAARVEAGVEKKSAPTEPAAVEREFQRIGALKARVMAMAQASRKATDIAAIKSELATMIREQLPAIERGRFVAMVAGAKSNKDFMRAALRVHDAVEEWQKKTLVGEIKSTVRSMNKDAREGKGVAIEYVKRINDLLDDYDITKPTEATIDRLKSLADFVKRERREGNDIEVPGRILAGLDRLTKTPLADIDLATLINLDSDISALMTMGEAKLRARKAAQEAAIQSDLRDLKTQGANPLASATLELELAQAEADDLKRLGKDIPTELQKKIDGMTAAIGRREPGKTKTESGGRMADMSRRYYEARDAVRIADLRLNPMDVIFDILDGAKGYTGVLYRKFKTRIDNAFAGFLNEEDGILDEMKDKIREHGITWRESERIGVYAVAKQESGREKLNNAGIPDSTIDEIVNGMTDKELAFYRWMRTTLDSMFPDIKETMRVHYNLDVESVADYFPFLMDWLTTQKEAERGEAWDSFLVSDQMSRQYTAAKRHVEKGFSIGRVGAGKQAVRIDAVQVFQRHIKDALYLTHVGPHIVHLGRVSGRQEFREAVGDYGAKVVQDWIDTLARHGGVQGERAKALDAMRRNMGAATLGFKIVTAAIQVTPIIHGMSAVGPINATMGLERVLTSKVWRTWLAKEMPEIRHREGDDPAYLEYGSDGWLNTVRQAGFVPLKMIDLMAASSIAAGSYAKSIKAAGLELRDSDPAQVFDPAGKMGQFGIDKAARTAIAKAELVVRRTQASAQFKDAPPIVTRGRFKNPSATSRSWYRVLLQFQNYSLNLLSYLRHEGFRKLPEQDAFKRSMVWAFWIASVMGTEGIRSGYDALISSLFGQGGDDDERRKQRPYIQRLGNEMISNIPFISSIVGSARFGGVPVPLADILAKGWEGAQSVVSAKTTQGKIRGGLKVLDAASRVGIGMPGTAEVMGLIRRSGVLDTDEDRKHDVVRDSLGHLPEKPSYNALNTALTTGFEKAEKDKLLPVKDADGKPLIRGKRLMAYTTSFYSAVEEKYGEDFKKKYVEWRN